MDAPETPHVPEAARPRGLEATLTKKAGPLPVWLWAGIGLGAVLLILRRGSSGGGGTTPSASDLTGGDGAAAGDPGALDLGPVTTPPGNSGGFEDPAPSPNPPASDPVTSPSSPSGPPPDSIIPALLTKIALASAGHHGDAGLAKATKAARKHARSDLISAVVHPHHSPAGVIAHATTVGNKTGHSSIVFHLSSKNADRPVVHPSHLPAMEVPHAAALLHPPPKKTKKKH